MAEDEMQKDPWLAPLLEELPRAAQPSDLLEERTVRALRKAGVLRRRALLPDR